MAEGIDIEEMERQGLVGHSYDHLFSVTKRLRKGIPLREGLTWAQIGYGLSTAVIMLVAYIVFFAKAVNSIASQPAVRALLAFTIIFGPAWVVSQRVASPMPGGKTISGYISSAIRFWLDDPVHRRGRAVDKNRIRREGTQRHDMREWVPTSEYSEPYGTNSPSTRVSTEKSFTGLVIDSGTALQAAARAAVRDQEVEESSMTDGEMLSGWDARATDGGVR